MTSDALGVALGLAMTTQTAAVCPKVVHGLLEFNTLALGRTLTSVATGAGSQIGMVTDPTGVVV